MPRKRLYLFALCGLHLLASTAALHAQEPARKLVNLQAIPVLNVSGEASYHRPYAHCTAKWLNQAGVKTTFVNLEDVGLRGNGHQMMSEKNSAGIAKFLQGWIEKNVR